MPKIPEVESLYHNLEYRDGTVYLNFNGENKKYVGSKGEEIILDGDNKPVYDPAVVGTYNYFSYPVDENMIFDGGATSVKDTWTAYVSGGDAVLVEPEDYITLRWEEWMLRIIIEIERNLSGKKD